MEIQEWTETHLEIHEILPPPQKSSSTPPQVMNNDGSTYFYAESDSSFFTNGRCRDFTWLSKHLNFLSEMFRQISYFK